MAVLSDSFRQSSINLNNISNSLASTKRSLSVTNDSVSNISKIISNNNQVKRNLFEKSSLIQSRREEASRRQEKEDELESFRVSTSPVRASSFISRSEKDPLGRLLGFLGFLTAGWIVENLPTWIFAGKEFVSRIYKFGDSMTDMVSGTLNVFNSIGSVLQNSLFSILSLDFSEFTEGSVAKSFDELNTAVQDLGINITDTFKLFTTPLTESIDTGERAPDLGEDRTETMFPEIPQTSGTSSRVTGIHKQALDIISGPESGGSYNAMNQGTIGPSNRIVGSTTDSKNKIGKSLTSMTLGEIMQRQAYLMNKKNPQVSNYGIYAAGRYQIIPITFPSAMKNAGLSENDLFTPENQDRMGIAVLKSQGIGAWTSGGSRYSASETAIINKAKNTPISYSTTATKPSAQIQQVPTGGIKPIIGDRIGAGRNHGGVDLQVPNGTPLRAISDGTIVDSDYQSGWGNFLVMKDNLGIYHLYGHMQSGYKRGGSVRKGEVIGNVGMTGRTTGPHLHWEAGTGWNGYQLSGKFDALNKYSRYAPFNTKPDSSQTPSSPAQISSQPKSQQPSAITPERKGSEIVVIDDTTPQQPQMPYGSSQETIQTPTTNEFNMLNNFIKNKLLLDLAYL